MIGILGGTFDPIHFGHLRPALEVQEHLGMDEVRFIPCGLPPHRRQPAVSVAHRAAMVELAVQGQPGFVMDPRELQREGPSYSVDTLESLRAELGQEVPLCLMLGMDAFAGLSSWHRWREITRLAHVVVSHRPGSPASHDLGDWMQDHCTLDPQDLRRTPAGRVFFLPVTQLDISATAIRRLIARGYSPLYLTPRVVVDYIADHGLYGPAATR
ncbi:nicotinate-nucleotide adenylyltransferase [Ectothiorhodospira haloalkaliphila]|uniref:Probable nicotinate-nucleotide adenylyltransferase n=1 Tax=Ectothiorhodospira haloalkaliphila TaxID=421628 RepID=W8KRT4_9GAMM|nr:MULTISPECIES: nicotinate-nucleotide adenylyltransferase [Ectothiorhodospira]AHK79697.1 nicotinate-nucleotide adenylyltransferase [Ectothiorhodospira haloalkaliphila]MCG5495722.1 nicotinate-nucleotide adenylyltransferase [Ectothiorhodospira variabilis]MCG5498658.1 nicotinate-nucleotide adenylyltransferase [Ectothiorhodospira variabilis]MCG5503262.1 nicotinate-nucleotide adenylyltransferase [Ectothiorhodospira variabilis]MCG5505979.1 nicotinate-nucleotide adenylyltransferase [Ectothiorhodospi